MQQCEVTETGIKLSFRTNYETLQLTELCLIKCRIQCLKAFSALRLHFRQNFAFVKNTQRQRVRETMHCDQKRHHIIF